MINGSTLIYKTLVLFTLIITVSGSALHGPCETNDECGTLDTFCNNGTCVCKDGFAVFYDHCVQLAVPTIPCSHKSTCKTTLGVKGTCLSKRCTCKSFHHLHNKQCIKSKGLDEECDAHHQCYCGEECNDKIQCLNRTCTCRRGFMRYSRRCIPDPHFVNSESTSSADARRLHHIFIKLLLLYVVIGIKKCF